MNNTTSNSSVEEIQQEIEHLVSEMREMCVQKFKNENEKVKKLDFDPTLEQLYFLASPKSQVNNISGMIIDILNDEKLSPEKKLQLLNEKYQFAIESLQ